MLTRHPQVAQVRTGTERLLRPTDNKAIDPPAQGPYSGWWADLGVRLELGDAVRGFFGESGQRSHAELKRSAPAGRLPHNTPQRDPDRVLVVT